jgi:hypothetical protein
MMQAISSQPKLRTLYCTYAMKKPIMQGFMKHQTKSVGSEILVRNGNVWNTSDYRHSFVPVINIYLHLLQAKMASSSGRAV